MKQKIIQIFLFFLLILPPTFCLADELIIEPDMGRQPIYDFIATTQKSLSLVMYGFTDAVLLKAILAQHVQHKDVKVLLEQHPYNALNENGKTIKQFKKNHLAWRGKLAGLRFIHQKTLIQDQQAAMIMTFNFTHSAFKNQRNFALIIHEPSLVKAIQQIFNADWEGSTPQVTHQQLLVSPVNSRSKLIALIQQAKQSIYIYAQYLSDKQIIAALAKAARQGVHIKLQTSKKLRPHHANYLEQAGVHIRYQKKYFVHAKVFIFDASKAVIGSINLSKNALDHNRELAIISDDAAVIQKLRATFDADWHLAIANQQLSDSTDRLQQFFMNTLKASITHNQHMVTGL